MSFGVFSGLAASLIIYFTSEFGLTAVEAGTYAAMCTLVGAVGRPLGGALADQTGGIRALFYFYTIAAAALVMAAFAGSLALCAVAFFIAGAAFGMANGSVFQLHPQRTLPPQVFGLKLQVTSYSLAARYGGPSEVACIARDPRGSCVRHGWQPGSTHRNSCGLAYPRNRPSATTCRTTSRLRRFAASCATAHFLLKV